MKRLSASVGIIILISSLNVYASNDENSKNRWDGLYIGGSIGAASGKASPNVTTTEDTYFHTTDDEQLDSAASKSLNENSLISVLSLGYNVQQDGLLYGLEGDVTYSKFDKTLNSSGVYLTNGDTFHLSTKVERNWLASIRGKLGYVSDDSVIYFSLGPAITQIKYKFSFNDSSKASSFSETKTHLGIGASLGYERSLSKNWSVKAEYMVSSFINLDYGKNTLPGINDGFSHKLDLTTHSISLGLNYYF